MRNRKAVVTTLPWNDVATAYPVRCASWTTSSKSRNTHSRRARNRWSLLSRGRVAAFPLCLTCAKSEQLVDTAAQTIPGIEQQIEQTENQIKLLLGESPGEVTRGHILTAQELPPEVPPGLPSELLERRPDIRAAELDLIAANAQIGVARAAYFPQLSLSGTLGGQSTQLATLLNGPHSTWNLVPQLTQPIFTAGRLKSNVKLAEAEREVARSGAVPKDHPNRVCRGYQTA